MILDLVCLRRLLAFTAMTSQPEPSGKRTSASGDKVSRNRDRGALCLAAAVRVCTVVPRLSRSALFVFFFALTARSDLI